MLDAQDIYSYDDYREFLRDWFWLSKESDDKLSFRSISKTLGLKAPNHFHLVISKKRHLSPQTFDKVKQMLALAEPSEQYFDVLFHACTATSNVEQMRYQRLVIALRKMHNTDESEALQISISSIAWYIKTSAYLFQERTTVDIAEEVSRYGQFAISSERAEQALALLKHQGVMTVDEKGRCQFSADFERPDSDAIIAHHRESLNLALQATRLPQNSRYFSSVTIPADADLYQSMIEDIRASCVSWLERANERATNTGTYDRVMTLQFSLFPFLQWQHTNEQEAKSRQRSANKEQSSTIS